MLAVGALHSDFSGVPAFGYLDVLLALLVLDAVFPRPVKAAE